MPKRHERLSDLPEAMPDDLKEGLPEDLPDNLPEDLPDNLPEDLPDNLPEDLPDDLTDDLTDDLPEAGSFWENAGTERHTHVCQAGGERLDLFLSALHPEVSRSHAARLIAEGLVTVDGKPGKPGQKLKAGQLVQVEIPRPVALDIRPQDLPISILYEDDDLLVVDKAKGMVVHPAPGHPDGTLVNALMHHCGTRLSDINGVIRPGIVHRIDRDTSGLLVVAKNNHAHQVLSDALRVHDVRRTYHAVVDGVLGRDEGTVDAPIGRHAGDRKKMAVNRRNGRSAVTNYRVLRRYRAHTLVECELETGRTHQIRVHMAHLGHPVTGDPVYGRSCRFADIQGQALHAWRLTFVHPGTGERMLFQSPTPSWLDGLLRLLATREGSRPAEAEPLAEREAWESVTAHAAPDACGCEGPRPESEAQAGTPCDFLDTSHIRGV